MRKFIQLIWDSGAWIGMIVVFIMIALLCTLKLTSSSYSDMRSDVRNISNSLLAWQNGTQLPDHYDVEYIKKSDIFHNPFCRSIREVKTKECTKEKAVSKGLLPCKTCTP
jgi:hypothetical protein